MSGPVYGTVAVAVGVTVGLGVAAGGLGVLPTVVGAGVADGAALWRGAAVAVWRPDGDADGRVADGTGVAGWVAELAGVWAGPPTWATVSGRTSR